MRSQLPAILFSFILVLLLSACTATETNVPVTSTPTATSTPLPPPAELTVCLGSEPPSLYPIDNPSLAAQSVLAALYDGPVDVLSYQDQPVILTTMPTLENGDAQIFQTSVYVGDEVVDANGLPVTLTAGVRIRPAGCRSQECAIVYDGRSEVPMDQMTITFRLRPGLAWSDGEPLTAADSVYSYELAATLGTSLLVARTQSYEAADDVTVQWWGKPGYIVSEFASTFFFPLPAHVLSSLPADAIAESEAASRTPLGWGPYQIQEWESGSHITLTKNLHYFRRSEGLPKIDVLTFRFISDPETAISELLAGKCDVLDVSVSLDGQVALLQSLAQQGQIQAFFSPVPVMEQLAFGISPAAYDNGYNPQYDRPDYFGDVRVRQAVAMCIDRQRIVEEVLYGLSSVPLSYVYPAHPFYAEDVPEYPFDVSKATALLEEAGWRDVDNNPATPRQAWNVPGIANGTPFEVDYVTTGAFQRLQVSKLVADSLAQCGIKVNLQYLEPSQFYAAGPDGLLFGRSFEMAEFAMGNPELEPPCNWYATAEIPAPENLWIGTNVSGYSNPAFDAACDTAQQSAPGEAIHADSFAQAQALFAQDLPVIPLYWRVKILAARPEVCGLSLDPSAVSLWNVENLSLQPACVP